MGTVDDRVHGGYLTFTADGRDFACQVTAVALMVEEPDPDEAVTLDGGSTVVDGERVESLDFVIIADHTAANGLTGFSWANRGARADFVLRFDPDPAVQWTGTVVVEALEVGGSVDEQILVDGSWRVVALRVPTGYRHAPFAHFFDWHHFDAVVGAP